MAHVEGYAGTVVNDAADGDEAWGNPENAEGNDSNSATVTLTAGEESQWLKATNYGFTLPRNVTIVGIQAEYDTSANVVASIEAIAVRLVLNDTIRTVNRVLSVILWLLTFGWLSAGGATDLWDEQPTNSDVENSTFGIAVRVRNQGLLATVASVRNIKITVYYEFNDQIYAGGGGVFG